MTTVATSIAPAPTDEEAAAIAAALTAALGVAAAPPEGPAERSRAWRFSGRWWTRPVPARRTRPYR